MLPCTIIILYPRNRLRIRINLYKPNVLFERLFLYKKQKIRQRKKDKKRLFCCLKCLHTQLEISNITLSSTGWPEIRVLQRWSFKFFFFNFRYVQNAFTHSLNFRYSICNCKYEFFIVIISVSFWAGGHFKSYIFFWLFDISDIKSENFPVYYRYNAPYVALHTNKFDSKNKSWLWKKNWTQWIVFERL